MPVLPTAETHWPVYTPDPIARDHPLNDNLAAWWLGLPNWYGGRSFYDLKSLNTGTLLAGASWNSTTRLGGWNHISLNQTSSNNSISLIPQSSSLINLPAGQSFSLAFWYRCGTIASATYPYLVGCGINDTGQGFGFLHRPTTAENNINFAIIDTAYPGAIGAMPPNGTGVDNAWHWMLGVVDRVNAKISLYLDGNSVASTTITINTGSIAPSTALNAGLRLPGGYWSGQMDDIRFWLRALSASDAAAGYDNGMRRYPGTLNRYVPRRVSIPPSAAYNPMVSPVFRSPIVAARKIA